VEYRNRRDRDLLHDGWRVFHFSGGEVVTRPDRCVAEVLRHAYSAWTRLLEVLYRRKRLTAIEPGEVG
jgi:very-short-patch-repair endonuclease